MTSQPKWFAKLTTDGLQYIEKKDWTKITHRVENRKQFEEQFKNEREFLLSETSKHYKSALDKVIYEESPREDIARIPWKVAFDGQERPLLLDREMFEHIFKRHWDFLPNNLLETANNPDYIIRNVNVDWTNNPDKINLIKQLLNTDKVLIIGADRQNGFFILTHLEVSGENVLEKLLSKWEII